MFFRENQWRSVNGDFFFIIINLLESNCPRRMSSPTLTVQHDLNSLTAQCIVHPSSVSAVPSASMFDVYKIVRH